MKARVKTYKLQKSLSYIIRSVQTKTNIPILSNVLIVLKDGMLRLSATNLDMSVVLWIPSMVVSEGSTTVSAKSFFDFISAVGEDSVDIEMTGSQLSVSTPKIKAVFNTIDPNDFPVLPSPSEKLLFQIKIPDLTKTLEKVSFSISNDYSPSKISLTGIYIEPSPDDPDKLSFVCLDGYRLSMRDVAVISSNFYDLKNLLVPGKYFVEICKILSDLEESLTVDVFLSEKGGQIIFKNEEMEIAVRLIEGSYPDFRRIIPDSNNVSFVVVKQDLDRLIKVMSAFSRENSSFKVLLDMRQSENRVFLSSVANEIGQNSVEIDAEVKNFGLEELKTAYFLRSLDEAISHIDGDKLLIETKGNISATVIKDLSDPDYLHILMPVRRDV